MTTRKIIVHYVCNECDDEGHKCPCFVSRSIILITQDGFEHLLDKHEKQIMEGDLGMPDRCPTSQQRESAIWHVVSQKDMLDVINKYSEPTDTTVGEKKQIPTNRFSDIDII